MLMKNRIFVIKNLMKSLINNFFFIVLIKQTRNQTFLKSINKNPDSTFVISLPWCSCQAYLLEAHIMIAHNKLLTSQAHQQSSPTRLHAISTLINALLTSSSHLFD